MFYSKFARNFFIGSIILSIISLAVIFFMYKRVGLVNDPEKLAQIETEKVVSDVSKIFDLPTDETPIIAIVKNIDSFKNEPFLKAVKLNDKMLIFEKNKKVVIYRPNSRKIVEVVPLSVISESSTSEDVSN